MKHGLKSVGKWKKNLESDIDCMEESMQPYIALFYAFRKIRHDFANYVQTLQLFAEVENYDEKKKMKENGLLFGGFFALREDDLIHKEEDDHGDAAVQHGGADVVDEVRYQ